MQYSSLRKANEFLFKMRRFVCAYTFIFYIKWKDFSLCWLRPQKSQALDVRHLLIYFITIIIKLRQKHKDELV